MLKWSHATDITNMGQITGVATMGPRGAMPPPPPPPPLLSYFSIVSMSWFTFAIVGILCCGPLTCFLLATPLGQINYFFQCAYTMQLNSVYSELAVVNIKLNSALVYKLGTYGPMHMHPPHTCQPQFILLQDKQLNFAGF